MYPEILEKLIECFRMLPSVGVKTAERYALQVLSMPADKVEEFADQLKKVKKDIQPCRICGNLSEDDKCLVCRDQTRDFGTICVVQEAKDVIAIEKMGQYRGVYHVLGGAISPIKGILPEDLNIAKLFERINEETKEVIIATNSTVDGETTALYITKILKNYPDVAVSRLASGLPIGGNLDYADSLTLSRAFSGRIRQ